MGIDQTLGQLVGTLPHLVSTQGRAGVHGPLPLPAQRAPACRNVTKNNLMHKVVSASLKHRYQE